MDPLGILLGALLALIVARLLFRPPSRSRAASEAPPPAPDRVTELVGLLTGDPRRDRPLQNRILSLGPGIVPRLLDELSAAIREPDPATPALIARLEELIADFGLAGSPRWSRCSAGCTRRRR